MPEMPHSIPARIESVSERVVFGTSDRKLFDRVHPVLLMQQSTYLESMGVERVETVCSLQPSPPPRVWLAGGDLGR